MFSNNVIERNVLCTISILLCTRRTYNKYNLCLPIWSWSLQYFDLLWILVNQGLKDHILTNNEQKFLKKMWIRILNSSNLHFHKIKGYDNQWRDPLYVNKQSELHWRCQHKPLLCSWFNELARLWPSQNSQIVICILYMCVFPQSLSLSTTWHIDVSKM